MANCAFGYANHVLDATVSADSQVPSLPAANIQSDQGADALAWRFTSAQATLTIDLGAGNARMMRLISLHRTNLSAAATVDLTLSAAGVTVWQQSGIGALPNVGQSVLAAGIAIQADRLVMTIHEPDMVDGFVSIPLVYAGDLWSPLRNMSTQSTSGWDLGTDEVTSLGGAEFPVNRWLRRRYAVDHQSLGLAELPALHAMVRWAATGRNVLFLPDSGASRADLTQSAVFGRLMQGDLSNPFGAADRQRTTFTITERL